jgi:prevent-host-death family protein
MKTIAISKFKATCRAVFEQVRKTHKPVLVTRFGKPVAQILPPPPLPPKPKSAASWLGSLAGQAKIVGDIISPAADENDWEALKD